MMYALLTEQGTAMAESALCADHSSSSYRRAMREIAEKESDYVPRSQFQATNNPELRCQVCGSDGSPQKFTLTIDTSNAAFADNGPLTELAGIIEDLAQQLRNGYETGTVRDSNGNTVGRFELR